MFASLRTFTAKIVLYFIPALLAAGGMGCQPYSKRAEVQTLDSLQQVLLNTKRLLQYDEATLRARLDTIAEKTGQLSKPALAANAEAQSAIIKLKGIEANYTTYLDAYPSLTYDQQELQERLAEVKMRVSDEQRISEDTHDALERLKKQVSAHQRSATAVVTNLNAVELDYDRQRRRANDLMVQAQ